jgi:predicted nucleotidyltransferase
MVTLQEAQEVARGLTAKISPVAVILFGSVAREGRGEDLDLLVVTGRDPDYGQVGHALEDYYSRFAIDYFVASVDQITGFFRKGSPWLRLIQQEGKVLYMDESFCEWGRLSLEYWEQAQYLLKGEFYRGACFSSQQAVERALKGEMLRRGWELGKTHSLRRLLSIAGTLELKLE